MTFATNWLNITEGTAFGIHQGFLVAIICLLGFWLIRMLPRYRWLAAAALVALVTPLATLGFWFSTGELGISDWDYYFSLHHTNRQTLLEYHQLPFWNPYICGGTAGLADPEFRFFTPTFLLQLIFGVPTGFRLAIWLATAAGAIGILCLGRRLNLSLEAGFLAGIAAAFGTVNLLEIVEGHPNIFAAMFIPWIFWAWLGAYRAKQKAGGNFPKKSMPQPRRHGLSQTDPTGRAALTAARAKPETAFLVGERLASFRGKFSSANTWYIITALFLALTFFQGGIYLLMYTAFAFLILPILVRRHIDAIKVSVFSGFIALGLAAVKIVPVMLWLQEFQDQVYASSALTLPYLHEIFLGRYLHDAGDIIPNQGSGWHEYGAYIGPVVLLLAITGAIRGWKNRAVKGLVIAAVLATLLSSTGPFLKPLFDQAPFLPRSNISRVVLFAVIPLSLLAGFGLESLKKLFRGKVLHGIQLAIIVLAAADLLTLAYPLSEQAFVLPRLAHPPAPAPSPIAYAMYDFKTRHDGNDYNRAYEATLQGYGTFAYCAVLGPGTEHSEPVVRTIHDEEDKAIISIHNENKTGSFALKRWTPNKTKIHLSLVEPSDILLNTNYAIGWTINGQPAKNIAGRVGTTIKEVGEYDLLFSYHAPGFKTGLAISIATILAIIAGGFYMQYRRDE